MPKRNEDVLEDGTVVPALTAKEQIFCAEYMRDFDAKNAAIRAGYKPGRAAEQGYQILRRPVVCAYIKKIQDERKLKLGIEGDKVVRDIAEVAFATAEDFISFFGVQTGFEGRGKIPAIAGIRIAKIDPKTGERGVASFNPNRKLQALDMLIKNLGVQIVGSPQSAKKANTEFSTK